MEVINVTNPVAPVSAGRIRDTANLNGARDIKIVGTNAYVAAYDGDRLTILNIATPATPTIVGNVNNATTLNGAFNVEIS